MFDMESEYSTGQVIAMGDAAFTEAPGVPQPIPEQVELGGGATNTTTLGGTVDRPGE